MKRVGFFFGTDVNSVDVNSAGFISAVLLLGSLLLAGCGQQEPDASSLKVAEVLGGIPAEGFETAGKIIPFHFPDDHGSHPEFRNEWWYLTGNLADEAGNRYGYQVTLFRTALFPPQSELEQEFQPDSGLLHELPQEPLQNLQQQPKQNPQPTQQSRWSTNQVWMGHVALTDQRTGQHFSAERFSRGQPGMAGAQLSPFKVWLDDWKLGSDSNDFPWQLSIRTANFSLQLQLTPVKSVVLQGDKGLSQKSPKPGNASYYYSIPRLATQGVIDTSDGRFQVTGQSWLDREWSTSALDKDQLGWDWFSLQLDDGNELMYYQIRDKQGQPHPYSRGAWIDQQGNTSVVFPEDIQLTVTRHWRAVNGKSYPLEWLIVDKTRNAEWLISPLLDDQFMQLSVHYWEGAVEIRDADNQRLVGRGYMELTGY